MICHACGAENRADRRFCRECGTVLATGCPSCGASNDPEDRFCGTCGTPLAGSAAPLGPGVTAARPSAPAAATAPVAERRLVSVLFADLVGFTTLSENRDPEETRELLSRYFDLSREIIGRYGGTVEKFIGDAVMAVWGAPTALEDDAELAVRAALELVDAIPTLSPNLQARAGVLTGEAAVTIGAQGEGMVAGDLVNTASRLQSVAEAGTVLVGEATERAAAKSIAFEQVSDQALKGKQAPVKAYRAIRVVAEVGGAGRSENLEAPFVGRLEELRLLKDLFHSTAREKRTRLVSVIGPGGIGKSRLAWEFLKYVDGLVDTTWWHAGRSPAYGEGISFWALGEMVRERCDLLETDDKPTTRLKIRQAVERWLTDDEERRWVEAALLSLLGVGEALPGGRDELFAAWRTFFERIAEQGTVVMLFEDLHWADTGLLDFIDHVIEWARNLPLYVVTLARPELLEKRQDWGAGKRNFTSVSLDPLDATEMRELLHGIVPGLPEKATQAIVSRADGIPLYAVETIRMLVADGKLIDSDGVYQPVGDISTLAVPETLTALIAARLDGLDRADRDLLQHASVLGQSFTIDSLGALAGLEAEQLEPRLRALTRREVLRFEAHPRSPERGQYAFVQSLIREVAYNTLARSDRRARHLAAARYFEGIGGDELAGALARHYLAAYENSPAGPEADALAAQARIALRGAGDRAVALGSHHQASAFYEQALAVTSEPSEQAEILLRAGESELAAGAYADGLARLERAVELRRAIGEPTGLADAITALARGHLTQFQPSRGITLLEAALAELESVMQQPSGVSLRSQLARAYMMLPDAERALSIGDAVLADAEHANLVEVIADTLITRGTILCSLWRPREGLGAIRAGTDLAEQEGLHWIALRGLNNQASMLSEIDPRAALEVVNRGLALSARLGQRPLMLSIMNSDAGARFAMGDWQGVVDRLEPALADEPDENARTIIQQTLTWTRAFRGQPVDDEVAEQLEALQRSGEHMQQTQVHDLNSVIAFARGDLDRARREARTSNDMEPYPFVMRYAVRADLWLGDLDGARADMTALSAVGAHGPLSDAQNLVFAGGIAALEGDRAGASQLYGEGRRSLREHGIRFMLALGGIDMALLLPGEPDTAEAIAEAREILTEIGALPFLERLEAAAAGAPLTMARRSAGVKAAAREVRAG